MYIFSSRLGVKKAWATPIPVSFRGLIQNFRLASPPLSYAETPPPLHMGGPPPPPPPPEGALASFLEEVKLEFAENQIKKPKPNLTHGEQLALKQLIVVWQRHYTQRAIQGNNIRHDEQRK